MEAQSNGSHRYITARDLTVDATALHMPSANLYAAGSLLVDSSMLEVNDIDVNPSSIDAKAVYKDSTIQMAGRMFMHYSDADVIFDGGDFTATSLSEIITGHFGKILYRGGTGIVSGKWSGMDGIRVAVMDTIIDAQSVVKLGNLGSSTYTLTPLGEDELLRGEELMKKSSMYKKYSCLSGYELSLDPDEQKPVTLFVPVSLEAKAFTFVTENRVDTVVSLIEDGFCRFTVYGSCKLFLAGEVEYLPTYTITISRVLPNDVLPSVSLISGDVQVWFNVDSDGIYTIKADNSVDSVVSISASGYQTKTFTISKGQTSDRNLGEITLEPMPKSGIVLTHITTSDNRVPADFAGVNPELSDSRGKLRENTDYTLSYPYILLSEAYLKTASADDTLKLTLSPDDSMALLDGSAQTSLRDLSLRVELKAWGKADIKLVSSFEGSNQILIFDSNGALVQSGSAFNGKTFATSPLRSGSYTVAAFNSNKMFSAFGTLSALSRAGLTAGKDYASAEFTVEDTLNSELSLSVPMLNLSNEDGIVDYSGSSASLYPASVSVNRQFRCKLAYAFNSMPDGDIVINLPAGCSVLYVSSENVRIPLEQVYDKSADTLTLPVSKLSGEIYVGMIATRIGLYPFSASLVQGESLVPIAGLSFMVNSAVNILMPSSTDSDGFTATLRGTPETQLKVELNGKLYTTVTTNRAGTASVKIEIPSSAVSGEKITVRAYDSNSSDESSTLYIKEGATNIVNLSASYSMGTVYFVKDSNRVKKPYYSYVSYYTNDRWTLTAELKGPQGELNTDEVDAQIMLSDNTFKTVHMKLTGSRVSDGIQTYTFKGMYLQKEYSGSGLPVNVTIQYVDSGSQKFTADTESRLDYAEIAGTAQLREAFDEIDAEYEQSGNGITNQKEANQLIEGFKKTDTYNSFTPEQKSAYDSAAAAYKAPEDSEYDENFMISGSYKSDSFEGFSQEQIELMQKLEEDTQNCIDAISAFYKLKKPMNEYGSFEEILAEMGMTVTQNYTSAPGSDFTRVDKYLWYRHDSERNVSTSIDVESKLKVEIDYGKIKRRSEEINNAVKAALQSGKDSEPISSKSGEPVGDGGDLSVETAIAQLKDRMGDDDIESEDLVSDYADSGYEYFMSDFLDFLQEASAEDLAKFKNSQAISYEKLVAEEIAKGGDGTKALLASEKYVNYIKNAEKNIDRIGKASKIVDYAGDAVAIGEALKAEYDMAEYDKELKEFAKIRDIIWDSELPIEEKLKFLQDDDRYTEALIGLKGISWDERDANLGSVFMSSVGRLVKDPVAGLIATGSVEIITAPNKIRNSYTAPSYELTLQLERKRIMSLLERVRELENNKHKKKQSDQGKTPQDLPYDSFGSDIDPEVAEWYYQARLEAAKKRGIDVDPILDPSGIVYEALEDNLLEGVTATIWYSPNEDGSKAVVWNAADYDQDNPQITDKLGGYAWDVPEGWWQVRFEKEGFLPASTDWLSVPPPQLNLKTAMVSTETPLVKTASAYPDYVEITFTQYMNTQAALSVSGFNIQWVQAQISPDGKKLSKTLRLVPETAQAVGEKLSFTLSGAENYAGTKLDDFTSELTVVNRPVRIELSAESLETYLGGSTALTARRLRALRLTPTAAITLPRRLMSRKRATAL